MTRKISFIHAADLHLDSPFKGLTHVPEHIFKEIQESTFVALDHLVEAAIERQVDFVLLAGDLFDNEKQSLKAQIRLRKAFEKLKQKNITVYLSYGNHDYIKGNIHPIEYPDNVFIFNEEKVSHYTYKRDGQELATVYGFSYENRAVLTNKSNDYYIHDENVPFHIAMLHGSLASNTEHDVYAPFKLTDLTEQRFDYWALGHIHQREILSENPEVVYPGNTQGRHRKETGKKGCYHVVINETGTDLTFIELQSITFRSLTIDISTCKEPHQLESIIETSIDNLKGATSELLAVELTTTNPDHKRWENDGLIDDMVELMNESAAHQANWYYIFNYAVSHKRTLLVNELYKGDHFIGELLRYSEEASIQPFVKELYHHRQARKFLKGISEEDEKSIKSQAQQLLLHELVEMEGD